MTGKSGIESTLKAEYLVGLDTLMGLNIWLRYLVDLSTLKGLDVWLI